MAGPGIAQKVPIRFSLVALLLVQLAFVAHGTHFDADDGRSDRFCVVCVASASDLTPWNDSAW
jgi:hypothetical protein